MRPRTSLIITVFQIQPTSVAVSDLQEMPSSSKSNQTEHNYSFQIMPTPLRNVEITPPPLLPLENSIIKEITTGEESLIGNEVPSSKPSKVIKKSLNVKQPSNPSKWKASPTNIEKMHEETLNVLGEINMNIKNLSDSQNKMCTIHEQLLELLKKK